MGIRCGPQRCEGLILLRRRLHWLQNRVHVLGLGQIGKGLLRLLLQVQLHAQERAELLRDVVVHVVVLLLLPLIGERILALASVGVARRRSAAAGAAWRDIPLSTFASCQSGRRQLKEPRHGAMVVHRNFKMFLKSFLAFLGVRKWLGWRLVWTRLPNFVSVSSSPPPAPIFGARRRCT